MAQTPRADANGLICPLLNEPMCEVCHTCPMWTMVRGTDNNTGEEIDAWDCAYALMPRLMIENSNQQRSTSAAIESFRNEMVKANRVAIALEGNGATPHRSILKG